MALRAGYQGFKKLLPGLKLFRPGCLGIDNSELSKTFFPRSEQEVYGSYNVIPYPYDGGGATQTVTLTSDDDGVMSLNGTVTGGNMRYDLTNSSGNADLAKLRGTWKLTVEGALPANAVINIRKSNEAAVWSCAGNSEITIDFTDSVHTTGWIYLYAPTGTQFSDNTIKVMLSKNGGAYVPYAMTNQQLTDALQGITVKKFTSAELTINAGQYSAQELNIANGDLIPLGVVGYTIAGAGNTDCSMWKNCMDLASKKVLYGVKNNGAETQATVTVDIFVLYKG